jgi:DUF971 family protein
MNKNEAVKFSKPKPYLLMCKFKDGFEATIRLEDMRNECPGADSQEERKNAGNKIQIPGFNIMKKGRNELKELKIVGNYAINPVWGDDHSTGIYTWELVRKIFETYKLTDEQINELEKQEGKKLKIPELTIRTSN